MSVVRWATKRPQERPLLSWTLILGLYAIRNLTMITQFNSILLLLFVAFSAERGVCGDGVFAQGRTRSEPIGDKPDQSELDQPAAPETKKLESPAMSTSKVEEKEKSNKKIRRKLSGGPSIKTHQSHGKPVIVLPLPIAPASSGNYYTAPQAVSTVPPDPENRADFPRMTQSPVVLESAPDQGMNLPLTPDHVPNSTTFSSRSSESISSRVVEPSVFVFSRFTSTIGNLEFPEATATQNMNGFVSTDSNVILVNWDFLGLQVGSFSLTGFFQISEYDAYLNSAPATVSFSAVGVRLEFLPTLFTWQQHKRIVGRLGLGGGQRTLESEDNVGRGNYSFYSGNIAVANGGLDLFFFKNAGLSLIWEGSFAILETAQAETGYAGILTNFAVYGEIPVAVAGNFAGLGLIVQF